MLLVVVGGVRSVGGVDCVGISVGVGVGDDEDHFVWALPSPNQGPENAPATDARRLGGKDAWRIQKTPVGEAGDAQVVNI